LSAPARGEVWQAQLDPIRGHEQAGTRPILIVSDDLFNRGPAGLVIAVPITSRIRPIPFHVRMMPPQGGLTVESAALCEAVRSISKERLLKRLGLVSGETLELVEDRLRILLRL
jgi:mRNA interferase MazF